MITWDPGFLHQCVYILLMLLTSWSQEGCCTYSHCFWVTNRKEVERFKKKNLFLEKYSFDSRRELFLEDFFICLMVYNWVTWLLLQKDGQENRVLTFLDSKIKIKEEMFGNECCMDPSTKPRVLGNSFLKGISIMRLGLPDKKQDIQLNLKFRWKMDSF